MARREEAGIAPGTLSSEARPALVQLDSGAGTGEGMRAGEPDDAAADDDRIRHSGHAKYYITLYMLQLVLQQPVLPARPDAARMRDVDPHQVLRLIPRPSLKSLEDFPVLAGRGR